MEQLCAFLYFTVLGLLTAALIGVACWVVGWAAYKMEQWWEN